MSTKIITMHTLSGSLVIGSIDSIIHEKNRFRNQEVKIEKHGCEYMFYDSDDYRPLLPSVTLVRPHTLPYIINKGLGIKNAKPV